MQVFFTQWLSIFAQSLRIKFRIDFFGSVETIIIDNT
jgi:hypothetical protein